MNFKRHTLRVKREEVYFALYRSLLEYEELLRFYQRAYIRSHDLEVVNFTQKYYYMERMILYAECSKNLDTSLKIILLGH